MKAKKKHTLAFMILYLFIIPVIILFIVFQIWFKQDEEERLVSKMDWGRGSKQEIETNPDEPFKLIPEADRKDPTLENVFAFLRDRKNNRIDPQLYFKADSLGWLVNSVGEMESEPSFLYCADSKNPNGSIPSGARLYDYCFQPLEMYGRSFQTRFLTNVDALYSAAYILEGDTAEELYEGIIDFIDRLSSQYELKTELNNSNTLCSMNAYLKFLSEHKKTAKSVFSSKKPFTLEQEYTVIGDYTSKDFPGILRITVHQPKHAAPYVAFVWQREKHTLYFYKKDCCIFEPIPDQDGNVLINGKTYRYDATFAVVPENLALDY